MWYRIEVELPQQGHEIHSAEDLLGKLLGGEVRLVAVGRVGEEGEGVGVAEVSVVRRQTQLLADDDVQTNVEALRRLWNELKSPTQRGWTATGPSRMTAAKKRLQEHPSMTWWRIAISKIAASDMANGRKPDFHFIAGPDYLLRAETGNKAHEGFFDNPGQQKTTPAYVKPKGHYSTDPLTEGMWVADK